MSGKKYDKNVVIKKNCVECGNCISSCPSSAIAFKMDSFGSRYATVSTEGCIGCGICESVCPLNSKAGNTPIMTYAMTSLQEGTENSSSGGVFFEIAKIVLANNGVVYGAAYTSDLRVHHISIHKKNDIWKLQGSKYVKSDITNIVDEVYKDLLGGKDVLFSGTPCQVQAIKSFLLKKKYTGQLFTIDLVCHGTSSEQLFRDYLTSEESKRVQEVVNCY